MGAMPIQRLKGPMCEHAVSAVHGQLDAPSSCVSPMKASGFADVSWRLMHQQNALRALTAYMHAVEKIHRVHRRS